ncbi:hypothetical protein NQ317_017142, partial [Molorchus minor]
NKVWGNRTRLGLILGDADARFPKYELSKCLNTSILTGVLSFPPSEYENSFLDSGHASKHTLEILAITGNYQDLFCLDVVVINLLNAVISQPVDSLLNVKYLDMNDVVMLFAVVLCVLTSAPLITCDCPDIVTRLEWNASSPASIKPLRVNHHPTSWYIILQPDYGNSTKRMQTNCKVFSESSHEGQWMGRHRIQFFGKKTCMILLFNQHISILEINFQIGGDGKVYEGRGWGIHGAHVPKYNARVLNLSYWKFSIVEKGKVLEDYHLIGHRQGSATLCPGDKLYDEIQTWLHFDISPN